MLVEMTDSGLIIVNTIDYIAKQKSEVMHLTLEHNN